MLDYNSYTFITETVNGIDKYRDFDLTNYFPKRKSNNCIVFLHKKFLRGTKSKPVNNENKTRYKFEEKEVQVNLNTEYINNKCQKRNDDRKLNNVKIKKADSNKRVIPLVLPSNSGVSSPIVYTVKTVKKTRKKTSQDNNNERNISSEPICNKKIKQLDSKIVIKEANLKPKTNLVNEEFDCQSLGNQTVDDMHLTKSLSCSLTESTENEYYNNHSIALNGNKSQEVNQDIYEAIATEVIKRTGETKVKINLMNNAEKAVFNDNIKNTVLNAVKECLQDINNSKTDNSKATQRLIKINSQKLNKIYEKLSDIEKTITNIYRYDETKTRITQDEFKLSKLEELSEDLERISETNLEDDTSKEELVNNGVNAVTVLSPIQQINEQTIQSLGNMNAFSTKISKGSTTMGLLDGKAIRPQRIPARFCWTDASVCKP